MPEPANRAVLRGSTVRFRVADVLVPPSDELLRRLYGDDVLEGWVIQEAHSDGPSGGHVAVSVPGLSDPVVVLRVNLLPTSRPS